MKRRKIIYLCLVLSIFMLFNACGKAESHNKKENSEKQELAVEEKIEDETDGQEESSKEENINKTEDNPSNNQPTTETTGSAGNAQNTTNNTEKDKTNNQSNNNSNSNTSNKPSEQIHKHTYAKATCTKPQTCSCGATSGNSLGHNYDSEGICTRCSTKDPNFSYPTLVSMGGRWTYTVAQRYNDELGIELFDLYFDNKKVIYDVYGSCGVPSQSGACCNRDRGCVTWEGEHQTWGGGFSVQEGYSYTEKGNTIVISDSANRKIELQRTSTKTMKVISVDNNFLWEGDWSSTIVVGTVLTFENVIN